MNKICFIITLVFTILFQLISLSFAEEGRIDLIEPLELQITAFTRKLPPEYDPADRINPFQPLFDSDRTVPASKPHKTDCIAKIANAVLMGIENKVYIPNRSWLCSDCQFGRACDTW